MAKFRDYVAEHVAPPWLQQPKGTAWHRAIGDVMDSLEDRARQLIKARFPSVAPADAVARTGAERGIERGPGESLASYAHRVVKAWDAWQWCGTPKGILLALWHAGFKTARVEIVRGKDYSLNQNGELAIANLPAGSWSVDATPWFWSKFIVLFPQPHPWAAPAGVDFAGTGNCSLLPGGRPDAVHTVQIDCTTGGGLGSAVVTVTIDGQAAAGITVPANGILVLDNVAAKTSGVVLQFDGTTMAAGDLWKFDSGVFPASNSDAVEQLRRLVRRWKGTHATCAGIVVQTSGWILGWPLTTLGERGLLGGCERVIWPG